MSTEEGLLEKIAGQLTQPPSFADDGMKGSILTVTAASYSSRSSADEVTPPTGFDPEVATLFEAVVEAAYLVANADGEFDEAERKAFEHVVIAACGGVVERQISALLADLSDQLNEDGIDKRVDMVGRAIKRPNHAREVLRVAALIACVSGGVSEKERDCLGMLAKRFSLENDSVEAAVAEAERVLAA